MDDQKKTEMITRMTIEIRAIRQSESAPNKHLSVHFVNANCSFSSFPMTGTTLKHTDESHNESIHGSAALQSGATQSLLRDGSWARSLRVPLVELHD